MSPIIDLQRRLAPAGRIRIGEQVATSTGKTRPKKLTTFRFTSSTKRHIEGVARMYGGQPQPWADAPTEGQWELYTEASEIPIVVPPERMSFSQWYELWSAGGCQRRCDGSVLEPSGDPCVCDPKDRECEIHTRLSVMLSDLPGIGLWRLDTQGYYAATEIGGSFEIASMLVASLRRDVLPGLLRLEERVVKRAGKTFKFVVPVLDFNVDMGALALGQAQPAIAGPLSAPGLPEGSSDFHGGADEPSGGLKAIPTEPTAAAPSVAEQIQGVGAEPSGPRRANAAPPIPATGLAPRTAIDAESTSSSEPPAPKPPAAAVKKAPATKAATAKKGPPKPDNVNEPEGNPAKRSTHLDNGELRVTQPMVTAIQIEFKKMDPNGTRDARLRYARNVVQDESIGSTWDMSVAQASTLLENLKIVNGEEPPPHGDGEAA